jgi:hypothetical protein
MYQKIGKLYICGDLNARCGDIQDFIEGVDNVQLRNVIDDVSNRNDIFIITQFQPQNILNFIYKPKVVRHSINTIY